MEGLLELLGLVALIYILASVRKLGQRIESLEAAVRAQLQVTTRSVAEKRLPTDEPCGVVPWEATAPAPQPVPLLPHEDKPAHTSYESPPPCLDPVPQPSVQSEVDVAAVRLLRRMWNWIVVGEEYRKPGLSAEFAIATTWLIRAGVLIAVFAVGFGLQLSIARGLLGPAGRVSAALLCGTAFIAAGLRCLCKRYQMLGQGFIGGGLAMFYFAFYAAAVLFHLMPLAWSFVCMAAVTASAVVLAVRLGALSIAVFGALGGYATPLMLKSVHPDLPVLYAYLAVLATGMAGVSVRRQWPLLTWVSFALNSLLFLCASGNRCSWHMGQGTVLEVGYLCGFFAIYSTAIFIYAVRNKIAATPVEVSALFLNALVTLGGGALLIGTGPMQRAHLAVLAIGIAAFYVGHIWLFLARRTFDRALLSGFIALAVIFMGLALPLLFTGNVLSTMFALQAVALLWIGRRLASRMFVHGALGCYAIVLMRLALGLLDSSSFEQMNAAAYLSGLKDRVAEFVVPILALFCGWRLFRFPPSLAQRSVGDASMREDGAFRSVIVIFAVVFYAGFVAYVTRELFTMASAFLPAVKMAVVTVAWALFVFHLLSLRTKLSSATFNALVNVAVILVVVQWLFGGWLFCEMPVLGQLRHDAAFSSSTSLPRLMATVACLAVLLGARRSLAHAQTESVQLRQQLLCAALVTGFLYLTFETATCCTAYVPGFRAGAVSIAWGCFALSLLTGGLRFGRRELRLSGLALFTVTVGKVFLVDLAGQDVLYRLLAFGLLGGVLLLAAYAYLRNQDAFTKTSADGQETT